MLMFLIFLQDQGSRSHHPTLPGQWCQICGSDEPSGPPRRERYAGEIFPGAYRCRAQNPAGEVSL